MTTYAIGDVQGCFTELQALLAEIHFDANKDVLWFTGDLVNRGPNSLAVLRFLKNLGEQHQIVLGNHDLHLLAIAYGVAKEKPGDTLSTILQAPDKIELMDWLRHRPLLHAEKNYVMTHAGLPPCWDLTTAQALAKEVETILQGHSPQDFFRGLYGNLPDRWDENLRGIERLRCITNYFTRMRLCYADCRLDFAYDGDLQQKPADLKPWFEIETKNQTQLKIIFGHWAALGGKSSKPNIFPLDTGCVWGRALTAMRLEDNQRFQVQCSLPMNCK